jgi:bacteriochlorophyll 4-vinyl reductase
MSEARIGRVLVASLHQAIADVLPTRLDFYEHWLHSDGLRHGGIGLAPMVAVVGFLRTEGDAYERIMARAGDCAADWVVDGLPGLERRVVSALPRPLRVRAALRIGRGLVRRTYPRSRALVTVRRGTARIDVRRSVFCDVRAPGDAPLCRFYAAAFVRLLERFALPAAADISSCRATGGDRCTLSIELRKSSGEAETAAV